MFELLIVSGPLTSAQLSNLASEGSRLRVAYQVLLFFFYSFLKIVGMEGANIGAYGITCNCMKYNVWMLYLMPRELYRQLSIVCAR